MTTNGRQPGHDPHWNRTRHPDEETLSAYLDRELAPPVRATVAAHLVDCADCRQLLAELRAVTALLADLPEIVPPRSFALTPAMVTARQPAVIRWLPRLRTLTAVAAALLLFSFAPDILGRAGLLATNPGAAGGSSQVAAPAAAPAGVAEAPTPTPALAKAADTAKPPAPAAAARPAEPAPAATAAPKPAAEPAKPASAPAGAAESARLTATPAPAVGRGAAAEPTATGATANDTSRATAATATAPPAKPAAPAAVPPGTPATAATATSRPSPPATTAPTTTPTSGPPTATRPAPTPVPSPTVAATATPEGGAYSLPIAPGQGQTTPAADSARQSPPTPDRPAGVTEWAGWGWRALQAVLALVLLGLLVTIVLGPRWARSARRLR